MYIDPSTGGMLISDFGCSFHCHIRRDPGFLRENQNVSSTRLRRKSGEETEVSIEQEE